MSMDQVLQVVFSIIGFLVVFIINDIKKEVHKASESIAKLNLKMEVHFEKDSAKEKEIERINQDVQKINEWLIELRKRLHELGNYLNAAHLQDTEIKWAKRK